MRSLRVYSYDTLEARRNFFDLLHYGGPMRFLKDLSHERMLKTPLRILGMTALLVLASMYS
jgi:hypothetical protein